MCNEDRGRERIWFLLVICTGSEVPSCRKQSAWHMSAQSGMHTNRHSFKRTITDKYTNRLTPEHFGNHLKGQYWLKPCQHGHRILRTWSEKAGGSAGVLDSVPLDVQCSRQRQQLKEALTERFTHTTAWAAWILTRGMFQYKFEVLSYSTAKSVCIQRVSQFIQFDFSKTHKALTYSFCHMESVFADLLRLILIVHILSRILTNFLFPIGRGTQI